ncbi:MAG: serine--tRNA ligase [Candidatus Azosocius agrarius]|nr:MAG: serine--tRNA ligase [Gammaproteobacteria bacterium]
MINIKNLKLNVKLFEESFIKRGYNFNIKLFFNLEKKRKTYQVETEELQKNKNNLSKLIGLNKSKNLECIELINEINNINYILKKKLIILKRIQKEIYDFLSNVPNILHNTVQKDSVVLRSSGINKNVSFKNHNHYDLAYNLNKSMDSSLSSKISGPRFMILKNKIAQLHRAISQFMLDLHISEHKYIELYVPYLIKKNTLYCTGQLPKFIHDLFNINNSNLWLNPTGEVPLLNIFSNSILDFSNLPIKLICQTTCFRKEAGNYGRDTKGIIRQHQFDKIELINIVDNDNSYSYLEEITSHSEKVLKLLNLPYRIIIPSSKDIGFSSAKTYDIEVWLPGKNEYIEIASCSNTEDFQSRRMKTKYKFNNILKYVHMLNASGLAVGRTLIAILENYQDQNGSIYIPDVLQKYMNNNKIITKDDCV